MSELSIDTEKKVAPLLSPEERRHSFKLLFQHVNYTRKQKSERPVHILKNICGEFRSGHLSAILGPSGAGKTSALNVLSGFKSKGVSGRFELNNKERDMLSFRKISSYIPQDFAMLDLLTVDETINISTDLKLPMSTTLREKQQIVLDILQMLSMEKCRRTLVRDLSGGERKRLSIAIELITNPPIMFFDEPTSGLDSVASLQIIEYLRRLALSGRIIICVVHQPSSRLMQLFDDIVVLSRGEVLYAGPQSEMLPLFAQSGFPCPKYYNPADFVLEVGSEEPNDDVSNLITLNRTRYGSVDSLLSANDVKVENNRNEPVTTTTTHPHTIIELQKLQLPARHRQFLANHEYVRPKEQVGLWRQYSVLTERSLRAMMRNMMGVQLRLIMHIFIAVLMGVVFWDIGNDAARVMTNCSCIFFMILFIFFGNAMPSILLCPQDMSVFIREYLNGYYSMRAYYLAKVTADLPMQFICPTLFIAILYHMSGQPYDVGRFAMCWGMTLLTAVCGHFFGLVFGSACEMQLAVFLVPSISIPLLIFSGFFIRLHELSYFLRPLGDMSFFRYTLEGFFQAIYGYGRESLSCNADFCYFKMPQKLLRDELDMAGDRYGIDVLALLIWILFLKIVFFLTLVLRIRKAR